MTSGHPQVTRKPFSMLIFILATILSTADSDTYEDEKSLNKITIHENCDRRSALCNITVEVLYEEFERAQQILKDLQDLETELVKQERVIKPTDRKADLSLLRDRTTDPLIHTMELAQLPFAIVTENLIKRFHLSRDDIERLQNWTASIDRTGASAAASQTSCTPLMESTVCDPHSPYRTANGRCNNLRNPTWGSAVTCQQRLLPAHYEGYSGFRRSVKGQPLPAPRQLSLNLHYHNNRPTNHVTHMYMFFGQLLDHDMALTPVSTADGDKAIQCCPFPNERSHLQCKPIYLLRNDTFYSRFDIDCMNFVRSAICPTCSTGGRQQMNQVTSFIDASFVYGNDDNVTRSLRKNDGTGLLRTQRSNYGALLPRNPNPAEDQCSFPETNDFCFQAGDPRANQHTVLASLHTIFVREHNRIARELAELNPHWDEERLFQETRRILGAEMQAITYKEFLPITLGNKRMSEFDLWTGSSTAYDPSKNPTMLTEFTTAAFRFGHSMIHSLVASFPLNATNEPRLLRNEFFQPFDLYKGHGDLLMLGASTSPAQKFDRHLVPDVTNYLHRARGEPTGLDLAAINIQRGRDHGLPTYVDMLRHCTQGKVNITRFNDLKSANIMGNRKKEALRTNYRSVKDIDLWPGILMEKPKEGAIVGPTAACIIGMQFHNLKYGDRFYFEHVNEAGSFTHKQLQELRKVTLTQILCTNTYLSSVSRPSLPRNAMLFESRNNPMLDCKKVKKIDLSPWKEELKI